MLANHIAIYSIVVNIHHQLQHERDSELFPDSLFVSYDYRSKYRIFPLLLVIINEYVCLLWSRN